MGYEYFAEGAWVIPIEIVAEKLGFEEEWKLLQEEGDPDELMEYLYQRNENFWLDDDPVGLKCKKIVAIIDQVIPPDEYSILRPSDDMMQNGDIVEEGCHYLAINRDALFTMEPTPLSINLDAMGLSPTEDYWVTGG